MVISPYGKREAAFDLLIHGCCIRVLQSAAGQHSLLQTIKRDGPKLLPVTDELIFHDNLMDRQFSLV
jgi:hypothetical protein